MSVERTGSRTGLPYKVRWKHAGVHHARQFATAAAEQFDRKIKDLKAAGERHLLDERPRGALRLRDHVYAQLARTGHVQLGGPQRPELEAGEPPDAEIVS